MKTFIEDAYGITVRNINTYGNGQTSKIYKVITDSESYILKSHYNEQSASNEFHCLDVLSKVNLCPKPIRSADENIYSKHNTHFYILMKFINVKSFDKSKINHFNLGKYIRIMHSELSSLNLNNIVDRFNEEQLMGYIKSVNTKRLIEERYLEYKNYATDSLTNIHGDLGSWNLFFDNKYINVIDFGEAGLGDPFFDLAAVVESLNLKNAEITDLMYGYGHNDSKSMVNLSYMRKKWRLRGIIYLAVNNLKTEVEIRDLIKVENI